MTLSVNAKKGTKTPGPLSFFPWHQEIAGKPAGPLKLSIKETAARLRALLGGGGKKR